MKRNAFLFGVGLLALALIAPVRGLGGKKAEEEAPAKAQAAGKPGMAEKLNMSALLDRRVSTRDLQIGINVGEMVQILTGQLQREHPDAAIVVDRDAFNREDLGVMEAQVGLPANQPNEMTVRDVLRLTLKQLSVAATYLVRPGFVEITTVQAAQPERQTVHGKFTKQPLEEVLESLAEKTGISIVIDPRAEGKAKTPVSGHFRSPVGLVTAVNVLADMAGLKGVLVENTIYVTLPTNKDVPGARTLDVPGA